MANGRRQPAGRRTAGVSRLVGERPASAGW